MCVFSQSISIFLSQKTTRLTDFFVFCFLQQEAGGIVVTHGEKPSAQVAAKPYHLT
jgi:hypothetical protein